MSKAPKNPQKPPLEITLDSFKEFLLEKNRRYGNSALEPFEVFTKISAEDGIKVRIQDKLSRIKNNTASDKELRKNDVVDLMGYLMLLCVEKGWINFRDLLD
jgi:hypothetical protein